MRKREAIRECKRLWKEIEKSGMSKNRFLRSPEGEKWAGKKYNSDCPLCEYSGGDCESCPLQNGLLGCYKLGFKVYEISSPEWFEAIRNLKE